MPMLPILIQLVALLDLLFALAAVLFSVLLTARGPAQGADRAHPQAEGLRRWRRLAFQAAIAGFVLTFVLILIDLLLRSVREG